MNWIRLVAASLPCLLAAPTLAAPVFWLSASNEPGTPGLLDLTVEPNSTGQLHIWANADVRLSAVSLDLIAMGGSIKFTGAEIHNPRHCDICNPRWSWTSTPHVTEDSVSNIDAVVLQGTALNGIGPGSPHGSVVVFATVEYLATARDVSSLALQVGANTIADWDGNAPTVHFGTPTSPLVYGGMPGESALVGMIQVIPEPATLLATAPALAAFAIRARLRRRSQGARPSVNRSQLK